MPRAHWNAIIVISCLAFPASVNGQRDDLTALAFERVYSDSYATAVQFDTVRSWSTFVDNPKNRPSAAAWRGLTQEALDQYLQRLTIAKQKIEQLLFDAMVDTPSVTAARDYLRRVAALQKADVPDPWTVTLDVPAEREQRVIDLADPLAFAEANSQNSIKAFERYLLDFPGASRNADARARIKSMTENPARATIVMPDAIKIDKSGWVFVVTRFTEASGAVGYSVQGHIGVFDSNGRAWATPWPRSREQPSVDRNSVTVLPGGAAKDSFYFFVKGRPKESIFCGGSIVATWTGTDQYGNPIRVRNTAPIVCD